jgi:RES domain
MYCCPNCFWDSELKNYVVTYSTQKGNCDFCDSQNTEIIPPSELFVSFQPLISIYQPTSEGSLTLHECLARDWVNLFRIEDTAKIKILLSHICIEELEKNSSFLDVKVDFLYVDELVDNQEINWDVFVREIKFKNRFFIENKINLALLEELFKRHEKPYRKGKIFHRARICDGEHIYDKGEMGKPPVEKSTAGRANPKGISYLYVSNDWETTLYETRASLYDYVTLAEFKISKDINVLNLRDTSKISPFTLDDDIGEYLKHKKYLSKLEKELSKPIRRQDSELDYLPTQYLCEFIKSIGFDGVEFRSSLNPEGYNLAIFNDEGFECIKTTLHEVKSVKFISEKKM